MFELINNNSNVIIVALLTFIALVLGFLTVKMARIRDPRWARGINENGEFIDENGNVMDLPDPYDPELRGVWGRLDYIACSMQLQNRVLARSGHFPSVYPRKDSKIQETNVPPSLPRNGPDEARV